MRTFGPGEHNADRDKTFRLMLDHLAAKENPVAVETGCIRSEDDWTAGRFTGIVGMYIDHHGGRLDSVNLSAANVGFAKKWTGMLKGVQVHQGDSAAWLERYSGPKIDVFYADSLDSDQPGHAEHGLREVELALPHLAEDGLILIDDCPYRKGAWSGKVRLAVQYLVDHGSALVYSGYQSLLRRK